MFFHDFAFSFTQNTQSQLISLVRAASTHFLSNKSRKMVPVTYESIQLEYSIETFRKIADEREKISLEEKIRIALKIKLYMDEAVLLNDIGNRVINCTPNRKYIIFLPTPGCLFCVACLLFKVNGKKLLLSDLGYEMVSYSVTVAHIRKHETSSGHMNALAEYTKCIDAPGPRAELATLDGELTIKLNSNDHKKIENNRKIVDNVITSVMHCMAAGMYCLLE